MKPVLSAICLLLSAVPALAQGTDPPSSTAQAPPRVTADVVVTATLLPAGAAETGRSLFSMTREDLERMGISSIVEGLRLVPGVDPRARGPRDVQTDFSIRGATFGQTLVLFDGLRLNDSQSGHHNGDIPIPLAAIERIEVVAGSGSSVHGADALGGVINVIPRSDPHRILDVSTGEHGLFAAQGSIGGDILPKNWTLTGWFNRSSGFTFDREFTIGGAAGRGALVHGLVVDARHQRKAFGADQFYGNSPSKEWTDQTLGSGTWTAASRGWVTSTRAAYRNHGDHFRWDINRPGFAENRHRTNAIEGHFLASHSLTANGGTVAVGGSAGGDWIASSNLGDHAFSRMAVFAEAAVPLGTRATARGGVRVDHFSDFGSSTSPTGSVVIRVTDEFTVRGSASRGFRVPSFTELYYHDPANQGSPDLRPEHGWTLDGGAEWARGPWVVSVSPFRRWDDDVIDWVKDAPADLWRSTNVRDVTSTGFETFVIRRWRSAFVRVHYAGLKVEAPDLTQLSKYVLEYARHQSGGSLTVPVVAGFRAAVNVDHRHRLDGQEYDLVGFRLSKGFTRGEIYFDVANAFDETYHEVAGVTMPGRWMSIGFRLR